MDRGRSRSGTAPDAASLRLVLETKSLSEAANRTNEEVKKISAWAAIFFAPTLIATNHFRQS